MEYDETTHRWFLKDQDALIGWRIARAEPWKQGLVRLHLVRPGDADRRLVYAEGKACRCCGSYQPPSHTSTPTREGHETGSKPSGHSH